MFAARTNWDLRANRLSQAVERHRAAGREVLDLSESNPTRVGLEYPAELLQALSDPRALDYRPDPRGLAAAREAVATYYRAHGAELPLDNIFLATSTSEAYSFLFRLLCDPGDQVLVAAPSYPLFDFLASIQDVQLAPYPLFYDHGWHLDLHALESRLTRRARAVVVVHPNNPTGSFVKPEEAAVLGRLCAERGLALISDEVFLDYPLDGRPRPSLAAGAECLTFALGGLSKLCALPQMKLAWIAAAGPAQQVSAALERLEVIADTYLSVSTPLQLALPWLLEKGSAVQQELLRRVQANLAELDRQLGRQRACARLEVEGGWYAVLRVPVTGSDEDLAIALLGQGSVLVHPGHFYDFAREGHLVISLIPAPPGFSAGVGRVLAHLAREST